jgi:hypothetical protein
MDCHLETTEEPYSRLIGLRVFKCSLGHRSYGYRVSVSVIECRRSVAGDTWHFARTCSQWPNDNFVSVGYLPPKAIVCNECFPKAVDDSLPNSLQRARDQLDPGGVPPSTNLLADTLKPVDGVSDFRQKKDF